MTAVLPGVSGLEFLVDLDLRMIRPHVALAAVPGITRLLDGEGMPRVAGRARALRTVRIVNEGLRVPGIGLVTLAAADTGAMVLAAPAFLYNRRALFLVALDALPGFRGEILDRQR